MAACVLRYVESLKRRNFRRKGSLPSVGKFFCVEAESCFERGSEFHQHDEVVLGRPQLWCLRWNKGRVKFTFPKHKFLPCHQICKQNRKVAVVAWRAVFPCSKFVSVKSVAASFEILSCCFFKNMIIYLRWQRFQLTVGKLATGMKGCFGTYAKNTNFCSPVDGFKKFFRQIYFLVKEWKILAQLSLLFPTLQLSCYRTLNIDSTLLLLKRENRYLTVAEKWLWTAWY